MVEKFICQALTAALLIAAPGVAVAQDDKRESGERAGQPDPKVVSGRLHTWSKTLSMQAGYYVACREKRLIRGRSEVARHAAFMAGMVGEFLQLEEADYRQWNRAGYAGKLVAEHGDGVAIAAVPFTRQSCRNIENELLPFLNRTRRAIMLRPVR